MIVIVNKSIDDKAFGWVEISIVSCSSISKSNNGNCGKPEKFREFWLPPIIFLAISKKYNS
jgi:hypothetical protein